MSSTATTPRKGRPTPRQKDAIRRRGRGASRRENYQEVERPGQAQQATKKDPSPSAAQRRRAALGLIGCTVAAFVHVLLVAFALYAFGGDTSVTLVALGLAAAVTAVFVPYARKHGWHRWLALVGLALVTHPDLMLPTLMVAETWILHRFWVVEGPPRLPGRTG